MEHLLQQLLKQYVHIYKGATMEKIVIIILGSVIVNFALGTLKAIGQGFDFKLFFNGLGEVIKREIALLALLGFYWYFQDVEVLDLAYAPIAWFIVGLSTVYHLNSSLVNICALLGLEDVKVLGELDEKFKELKQRSFFKREGTE